MQSKHIKFHSKPASFLIVLFARNTSSYVLPEAQCLVKVVPIGFFFLSKIALYFISGDFFLQFEVTTRVSSSIYLCFSFCSLLYLQILYIYS